RVGGHQEAAGDYGGRGLDNVGPPLEFDGVVPRIDERLVAEIREVELVIELFAEDEQSSLSNQPLHAKWVCAPALPAAGCVPNAIEFDREGAACGVAGGGKVRAFEQPLGRAFRVDGCDFVLREPAKATAVLVHEDKLAAGSGAFLGEQVSVFCGGLVSCVPAQVIEHRFDMA